MSDGFMSVYARRRSYLALKTAVQDNKMSDLEDIIHQQLSSAKSCQTSVLTMVYVARFSSNLISMPPDHLPDWKGITY